MHRYFFILAIPLFLFGCKKDSATGSLPPDFSNDYFPFTNSYIWTYSTNAFSDSGKSILTFELCIDTATFRNGVFTSFKGRLTGSPEWDRMVALKDSGGIVYSIGDNPPESPFPLFKHQYHPTDGVMESITVSGTTYESIRIQFGIETGDTLFLWFAKGVGLIKESSNQGISLFNDNNSGKNILIQTTLVSVQK